MGKPPTDIGNAAQPVEHAERRPATGRVIEPHDTGAVADPDCMIRILDDGPHIRVRVSGRSDDGGKSIAGERHQPVRGADPHRAAAVLVKRGHGAAGQTVLPVVDPESFAVADDHLAIAETEPHASRVIGHRGVAEPAAHLGIGRERSEDAVAPSEQAGIDFAHPQRILLVTGDRPDAFELRLTPGDGHESAVLELRNPAVIGRDPDGALVIGIQRADAQRGETVAAIEVGRRPAVESVQPVVGAGPHAAVRAGGHRAHRLTHIRRIREHLDRALGEPIQPVLRADPDVAFAVFEQRPHDVVAQSDTAAEALDCQILAGGSAGKPQQAATERRDPQVVVAVPHQRPAVDVAPHAQRRVRT